MAIQTVEGSGILCEHATVMIRSSYQAPLLKKVTSLFSGAFECVTLARDVPPPSPGDPA